MTWLPSVPRDPVLDAFSDWFCALQKGHLDDRRVPTGGTHFANPMKSSWLVFMYASSQSMRRHSCSLQY
jgi:hypothetical protein